MMSFNVRSCWSPRVAAAIALGMLPALLWAAPRQKAVAPQDASLSVELFSAMEQGQIEVKVIPKDASQVRVFIANKTDQPLSVKLPEAFAAVPVLAQAAGGAGGRAGGAGAGGGSNANQGMGGGMGGGGMMGGGGGMGGGGMAFNVAPEKVGQFKATTVCLEYGKADPRPAVPYVLKPIESFTAKADVQELCRLLGQGTISQRVAQVAAWHLNNDMSWEQLAKLQYRFANGGGTPQFSPQEIQAAMQLSAVAVKLAEQRKQQQPKHESSASTATSQP